MSRKIHGDSWGPSHQYIDPPFKRSHPFASCLGGLFAVVLVFCVGLSLRTVIGSGSGRIFAWVIGAVLALLMLRVLLTLGVDVLTRIPRARTRALPRTPVTTSAAVARRPVSPAARVREGLLRVGGGAYLGENEYGEWVAAESESAVMILGPPRSGKTSAIMIPALMAASGAVVSTSTKPDVMRATMTARMELGEVWLFDPSASEPVPDGARRLSWSPVSASSSWDQALVMARAMTTASRAGAGTTNENHWSERAAALLGPLLYAAHLADRPIEDVLRWTLRQDLAPALQVLADADTQIAADVLVGIERTDPRERSSIFSATAGVLSAYNSDSAAKQRPPRTSQALGHSEPQEWLTHPTHSDTVSYQTHRQRVLTPGEIARLPDGHGLLLRGTDWELLRLTRWYQSQPWRTVASIGE